MRHPLTQKGLPQARHTHTRTHAHLNTYTWQLCLRWHAQLVLSCECHTAEEILSNKDRPNDFYCSGRLPIMMAPLVRKDITEIRLERASSHFLFSPLLLYPHFFSPLHSFPLLSSPLNSSPLLTSSLLWGWQAVNKPPGEGSKSWIITPKLISFYSLSLVLIVFCVIAFKMICFHWGKGTRQSWSEEHLLHLPYRTSKAPLRALSNNMCFKQTNKQMTGKSVRKK